MDPNPTSFPIVSYLLSRLPKLPSAFPSSPDLEQPPTPSRPAGASYELEEFVVDRMPDLHRRPDLLASMTAAVSDVAQARSVLRALGDRPDHETLDAARARLEQIEDEILPAGDGEGGEFRAETKKERAALRAIVRLDEMHEAYEGLLREAEVRLEKMYRGSMDAAADEAQPSPSLQQQEEELGREQADEEVMGILQEGLTGDVERVNLSGRQLRHLPEAFGKMRCLISLNLANNLLEVLPDAICGLEYLEELRVSSNSLVLFPDSIGLLSNLKILDVSGNKLKSLPDSIAKCRSLVELDASYNELTYLPTNIGYELLNLQKLFIHLNKIRSLPSSICEMRSLRILDAHFNELRGLPPAFGKLVNLEILDLSSNFSDMQELPDSFGDLINLKELDLSNNQIHALPDRFGLLDKLSRLNLEQNPLQIPPAEVVSQGVDAVKDYMVKRQLEILLEEERNSTSVETPLTRTGWLGRSASWLNNWVSGVSESVSGAMNSRSKTYKDPFLDRML